MTSKSPTYDKIAHRKEPIWAGHGYVNYFRVFQNLMRFRITNVLLVSSLYDLFLFEEDGRFYELVREEYREMNLSHSPEINHVAGWSEANEILLSGYRVDLIICTHHIEDMELIQFARKIRKDYPRIPLVLLAYDYRALNLLMKRKNDLSLFNNVFVWSGDFRLIIAIIKFLEDRQNLENDTHLVGVQMVILIEDNVSFYSSYLPILFTQLFDQSQRLLSEAVNVTHKYLRMRARPKVLLCTNYDEAWHYFESYKGYVLGIISDINFKRNGRRDPRAGIRFAKSVRSEIKDIPILLQSNDISMKEEAFKVGADFLEKNSPDLGSKIREYINTNFGFGDFIFRKDNGESVGIASKLTDLERELKRVPIESIIFHASQNHFSKWLKARTEFALAHQLRPKKVEEFAQPEDLREVLVNSLREYRKSQKKGTITDFNPDSFDIDMGFARLARGSLGGKARGLGFMNTLLHSYDVVNAFEGIQIKVPALVVIGTDVFDDFVDRNELRNIINENIASEEIQRRFLEATYFPENIALQLEKLLQLMSGPLAVRSSSLLEDSQYLPFAGVYTTHMLPNNSQDPEQRLQELIKAIKSVFASVYSEDATAYFKGTNYRQEDEKMAVIIQEMIGEMVGHYFYPHIAGVAKSYNYYPFASQKSEDGVVSITMGLGQQVVEGGPAVTFSPEDPKFCPQFTSVEATLKHAPKNILALNLEKDISHYLDPGFSAVDELDIYQMPVPDYASYIFSTYNYHDHVIRPGNAKTGTPVMTFAPVLQQELFPLATILKRLLQLGKWGMGSNVEIEFAVDLKSIPKTFAILQIRPIVYNFDTVNVKLPAPGEKGSLCMSDMVLGNGIVEDIFDIIWIDPASFERKKSKEVAELIKKYNAVLSNQGKNYLLIGPGRWGSADPWLGIPVRWEYISNVRVIVETSFDDYAVEPSQGSHFFQNLTSLMIPYFTIDKVGSKRFLDLSWLRDLPAVKSEGCLRHISLKQPLKTIVDGRKGRGMILKPSADKPV